MIAEISLENFKRFSNLNHNYLPHETDGASSYDIF